jgi:hypothetical protein
MSTHSASSVGSDFPIVNRHDAASELERTRQGERERLMRSQMSEVERQAMYRLSYPPMSARPAASMSMSLLQPPRLATGPPPGFPPLGSMLRTGPSIGTPGGAGDPSTPQGASMAGRATGPTAMATSPIDPRTSHANSPMQPLSTKSPSDPDSDPFFASDI